MKELRGCENCKHRDKRGSEEPCKSCLSLSARLPIEWHPKFEIDNSKEGENT